MRTISLFLFIAVGLGNAAGQNLTFKFPGSLKSFDSVIGDQKSQIYRFLLDSLSNTFHTSKHQKITAHFDLASVKYKFFDGYSGKFYRKEFVRIDSLCRRRISSLLSEKNSAGILFNSSFDTSTSVLHSPGSKLNERKSSGKNTGDIYIEIQQTTNGWDSFYLYSACKYFDFFSQKTHYTERYLQGEKWALTIPVKIYRTLTTEKNEELVEFVFSLSSNNDLLMLSLVDRNNHKGPTK